MWRCSHLRCRCPSTPDLGTRSRSPSRCPPWRARPKRAPRCRATWSRYGSSPWWQPRCHAGSNLASGSPPDQRPTALRVPACRRPRTGSRNWRCLLYHTIPWGPCRPSSRHTALRPPPPKAPLPPRVPLPPRWVPPPPSRGPTPPAPPPRPPERRAAHLPLGSAPGEARPLQEPPLPEPLLRNAPGDARPLQEHALPELFLRRSRLALRQHQ
mmetsp:Transcript_9210/g.28253  ORF Transcript_9210/g.28253 Transcript_9210/m.28253 type:complete len:212 (-) Transcript_9210:453-1088(-)